MSANLYIVPHDLTELGDKTLENTILLGRRRHTAILLLHLVDKESKIAKAKAHLEKVVADSIWKEGDPEINIEVTVGNIFDDIGRISEEKNARLVVMGTHGAKGMQKILGSYAIKVITSTSTPFLVVQDRVIYEPITKIVVPIDLTKESLQIINYAADLAFMFDAEVHIVGEKQSDARLANQIKIRIALVKKEYEEKNVKNVITLLGGSGSFQKKVVNYAKEVNAEMFALAYHSESLLPQFDGFAQTLITNSDKKPCLIINSEEVSNSYF
ncbi:universal stress protein [Lishizhenia sp.]|uniref:universal stress protein n=1 Tax=Lishizhenia sp. TaxID=2497594 RepID=UPI00299D6FD5|nr:universal stress protein [Lishizhenia sp.]MDX1445802.1 universal stress protein [Lishizhenia sp.]